MHCNMQAGDQAERAVNTRFCCGDHLRNCKSFAKRHAGRAAITEGAVRGRSADVQRFQDVSDFRPVPDHQEV